VVGIGAEAEAAAVVEAVEGQVEEQNLAGSAAGPRTTTTTMRQMQRRRRKKQKMEQER
jgi:hypothetical protein